MNHPVPTALKMTMISGQVPIFSFTSLKRKHKTNPATMSAPVNGSPEMVQIIAQPEPAHLSANGPASPSAAPLNVDTASPDAAAAANAFAAAAAAPVQPTTPVTTKSAIPTHAEITLADHQPVESGTIMGIPNRSWLRHEGRSNSLGALFGLSSEKDTVAQSTTAAQLEDGAAGVVAAAASQAPTNLSAKPPSPEPPSDVAADELPTEQFGHSHYSHRGGWLRAMVLGANDGLVSTASIMMGVSGGEADLQIMILTGLSGMVAGALSMACGEYVSVSSQKDSELADLKRERAEFLKGPVHRKAELEELVAIYINRGLRPELARQVAEEIHEKDLEEIVKVHARDELGIDTEDLARPFQAAWTSALAFCIGASIPLLAGSFIHSYIPRLISIIVVSSVALIICGTVGAVLGGAPVLRASIRVLIGGWIAMGVTFGVGKIFGVAAA